MRRSRLPSAALTAGLFLLGACSVQQIDTILTAIQPAQVLPRGTVTGVVLDEGLRMPIAAARVSVGPIKTETDATGRYEATSLPAGTWFVKVEAAGFQVFFGEVQVAVGQTRFDIALKSLDVRPSASVLPGSDLGPMPSGAALPPP